MLFIKNRDEYLIEKSRGKKVLHLGACDSPFTEERYNNKSLLHPKLKSVAKEIIGLDYDVKKIKYLNKKGFKEISFFDLNKSKKISFKPDIIIFADTLEHLMNLEVVLQNLKNLMSKNTELIISVPNANRFSTLIDTLRKNYDEHPDHSVSFRISTLKQLIEKNKLSVKKSFFCSYSYSRVKNVFLRKMTSLLSIFFIKLFPGFSQTLIVEVTK